MNEKKARHSAREYALGMVYSAEFHEIGTELAMPEPEETVDFDEVYADMLIKGVRLHMDEINTLINQSSKNWHINRIGRVELAILRIALFEMKFMEPPLTANIAINEAIILAKTYAHEDAYKFVNGILNHCVGTK